MSDQPTPDAAPVPTSPPAPTAGQETVSMLAADSTSAARASGTVSGVLAGGASASPSPEPAPSGLIAVHEVAQMAGAIVFVFCFLALGLHAISYAGY
ncbi:MAG: hypothetical protein ABF535_04590 [Acetobacter sp.]